MTTAVVSVAAFSAAALAAVWPSLRAIAIPSGSGLEPASRADWVNRLFDLAAKADAASQPDVAAAARALIAALVKKAVEK